MKRRSGRKSSPYRLELLEVVPAFCRKARRDKSLEEGQLVYYGPHPSYYGIGEVKRVSGPTVSSSGARGSSACTRRLWTNAT